MVRAAFAQEQFFSSTKEMRQKPRSQNVSFLLVETNDLIFVATRDCIFYYLIANIEYNIIWAHTIITEEKKVYRYDYKVTAFRQGAVKWYITEGMSVEGLWTKISQNT